MEAIKESFATGNSILHKTDPRLKLIIVFLFAIIIASGNSVLMLAQALFFSIVLLSTARLELKKVMKRIILVNSFTVGVWLFIPFTYGGKEIWTIGSLTASLEGIYYALTISLRINSIMLALMALLATSQIKDLLQALYYFKLPKKMIFLGNFLYRYIFVLKKDLTKLLRAAKARGLQNKTTLKTYFGYSYLIVMLILNSFERSERVYKAMLARGFNNEIHIRQDFKPPAGDLIFFIGSLLILSWFILFNTGILDFNF